MAEGPAESNKDQMMLNDVTSSMGQIRLSEEMVKCVTHNHGEFNGLTPTKPYLRSLLRDAQSKRNEKREKSLITITQITSSKKYSKTIDHLIKYGLLPILINCLAEKNNQSVQFVASRILNIICCEAPVRIRDIISANALPVLKMILFTSPITPVSDQIIWVLGNIICVSAQYRDEVLGLNFLSELVNFVDKSLPRFYIRRILWFINNIGPHSKTRPAVAPEVLVELLPTLNKMIQLDENEIIVQAIGTIDQIICSVRGNSIIAQGVIDADILNSLNLVLSHEGSVVVRPYAVRLLGNFIISGNDEHQQAFIDTGALLHFRDVLCQSNDNDLIKDTLYILSVIICGSENHIQAVIDTGLLPDLVTTMAKSPFNIQIEAVNVFVFFTQVCNNDQLKYVINAGIIGPLCKILTYEDNVAIIKIMECLGCILKRSMPDIEALTDIIEECGGLETIEKLQDSESEQVYRLSYDLVRAYFSEEST